MMDCFFLSLLIVSFVFFVVLYLFESLFVFIHMGMNRDDLVECQKREKERKSKLSNWSN